MQEGSNTRKTALTAGVAYIVIIASGIFAEFGVRQRLYTDDPQTTLANIATNAHLLRAGIACDLVMLLADVTLAWALYVVLRPVNKDLSLLAAFFRLAQAAVIGASLIHLTTVLGSSDAARVAELTAAHADGYRIGLAFFGACCAVLGWLVVRSGFVPKWIGALLFLAAAGYLFDTLGAILWVAYPPDLSNLVLLPAFVAEVSFAAWLLLTGLRG